jgi:hypothetical protein
MPSINAKCFHSNSIILTLCSHILKLAQPLLYVRRRLEGSNKRGILNGKTRHGTIYRLVQVVKFPSLQRYTFVVVSRINGALYTVIANIAITASFCDK